MALTAVDSVCLANESENVLCDDLRLSRSLIWTHTQVWKNHDKLVSTQTRYRIAIADTGAKPRGHFPKQEVARLMTEGVVECLEVVDVDEEQCTHEPALPAGIQCLRQCFREQPAIGQLRHGIVVGELPDLLLGHSDLGDTVLELRGSLLDLEFKFPASLEQVPFAKPVAAKEQKDACEDA